MARDNQDTRVTTVSALVVVSFREIMKRFLDKSVTIGYLWSDAHSFVCVAQDV